MIFCREFPFLPRNQTISVIFPHHFISEAIDHEGGKRMRNTETSKIINRLKPRGFFQPPSGNVGIAGERGKNIFITRVVFHTIKLMTLRLLFISVGGGTAGCALAGRLAEEHDWKVLLLESGGEAANKARVPWFHLFMAGSPHDWKYLSEPNYNDALKAYNHKVSPQRRRGVAVNVGK